LDASNASGAAWAKSINTVQHIDKNTCNFWNGKTQRGDQTNSAVGCQGERGCKAAGNGLKLQKSEYIFGEAGRIHRERAGKVAFCRIRAGKPPMTSSLGGRSANCLLDHRACV
jgi:hypothetical protein